MYIDYTHNAALMTRVAAPGLAGGGSGAPAEGGSGAPVQGGARREARGGAARGDRATQAAIGRLDQGPSLRARALPRQGQRAQGRRRGTYVRVLVLLHGCL